MAEFIGIEIENLEQVTDYLLKLPTVFIDTAANAVMRYWLGVLRNPRNYPKQKSVTRAEAYPDAPAGPGWFSDKQRKYVMAAIRRGDIVTPYSRTNTLAKSWEIEGEGVNSFLVNTADYASYVIDPEGQSRHEAMVGWWTAPGPLEEPQRIRAAEEAVDKAVSRAIKDLTNQ